MTQGLIEQIEQARCPAEACDSVIDRRHVFINYDRAAVPFRRTVKAFCDKCGRGWQVRQVLRGGLWHDEPATPGAPAVQELTGKALTGLRARVDAADGVLQTEALSA